METPLLLAEKHVGIDVPELKSTPVPKTFSVSRQLRATLRRQYLQKKRMPLGCFLEVFLPVIFILGLVAAAQAASFEWNPDGQFVPPPPETPQDIGPLIHNPAAMCYGGNYTELNETHPDLASFIPECPTNSMFPMLCDTTNNVSLTLPVRNLCASEFFGLLVVKYLLEFNTTRFIPTFDEITLLHWGVQIGFMLDRRRLFAPPSVKNSLLAFGKLYFVPNSRETEKIVAFMNSSSVLFKYVFGGYFDTYGQASDYVRSVKSEGLNWGVVTVSKTNDKEFEYHLSLNKSAIPWTHRIRDRFVSGLGSKRYELYYSSGFLSLQILLSDFVLTQLHDVPPSLISRIAAVPMPYPGYNDSIFLQVAGSLTPLVLVLAFLYPVSQLCKRLVEEKEAKLREGMFIMGLTKVSFFLSWLIIYALQSVVTSLAITWLLKVAILKKTEPTIVFLLFFAFSLSTVSFACLLSTFFSKSRISAMVAPVLFFLCSIPSFALPEDVPVWVQTALLGISPSAFARGAKLLFQYEIDSGMGWKDVSSSLDDPNFLLALIFLLADAVLYQLLTLYLDAVLPSEWGTQRHPLFCFSCFQRQNSKPIDAPKELNGMSKGHAGPLFEQYAVADSQCTVRIDGVRKEFPLENGGAKVAVENLNLKLFPDQIFVLLGHNGAGKTTGLNCLTGMLPMTSGDCTIYGHSVRDNLWAARTEIGFCPQHNILWDSLTCLEHLEFFGSLKGSLNPREEAISLLHDVDLIEKRDTKSKFLSGGQKRKLSVAIALIGGSRLLLLDECTAGMDVAARRHTWDMIRRASVGRTILLTTHFMDEADILATRIAIMSRGRLHSCGSSMFLKTRLGTGYVLKLTAENQIKDAEARAIESIVRKHVSTASVKEIKGQEISFVLPLSTAASFPPLLEDLETRGKTDCGIANISTSVSTLEDVFLRIAHEEEERETGTTETHDEHATEVKKQEMDEILGTPCEPLSYTRHLRALVVKRLHNSRRDRRTICLQIVLPLLCIAFAMLMAQSGPPDTPALVLNASLYAADSPQVIATTNCEILNQNFDPILEVQDETSIAGTSAYNLSLRLLRTAKSQGNRERLEAIACDDPTQRLAEVNGSVAVVLTNSSGWHSLPMGINEYYAATLRNFTRDSSMRLNVYNDPMPWTVREDAVVDSITTFFIAIFILVPFTFIPSTFVAFVVKERECKAKHQQIVSGVSLIAYWIANFIFDLVSFIVTIGITFAVFQALGRDEYIGSWSNVSVTGALFLLYGVSAIIASYAFSFCFSNHSSAQNIVMLVNFLCGFCLVLTNFVLERIESTQDAAKVLVYFFRLIPSFCLGEGILAIASAPIVRQLGRTIDLFDLDQTGWDLIFMGCDIVLFIAVVIILDHPSRRKRQQQLFQKRGAAPPIPNEDRDVARERGEVFPKGRAGDVISVLNLRKVYTIFGGEDKVAVKNLCLGVKQNEVFAFLGTNGAGKSTTMSVLTGELLPTCGTCIVNGFDVVQDGEKARSVIGYCPQFDAILDLLTPHEHLRLYADIRGIPRDSRDRVVDGLISMIGLEPFRSVPAKKLSGGNKRRLMVSLALIGGPAIVMLDEPSAGMDPVARRELWDVITHVSKRSCVLLTTHHLEEVDVLAHRVGIMVNGELRCIGALDHLKQKFGRGYEVNVSCRDVTACESAKSFVKKAFPMAEIIEEQRLRLTYNVPHGSASLAQAFQRLVDAEADASSGILEFTIQQSSLEQVFLRISAMDEDEQDAEAAAAEISFRGSEGLERSIRALVANPLAEADPGEIQPLLHTPTRLPSLRNVACGSPSAKRASNDDAPNP